MLDVQASARFVFKLDCNDGNEMAEQDGGDDDALARLEAALNRIAQHAAQPPGLVAPGALPPSDATAHIAARLDSLIGQIRAVLAEHEA